MNKNFKILSLFLFAILCFTGTTFGQETTGRIEGTTKDASGAIVPNVSITVTGVDIGYNRSITSDGEGFFRVQQVPAGNYVVTTAAVSGFVAQKKDNVQVSGGQSAIVDFQLSTTLDTVVNVSASDEATAIDTTDSKAIESLSARQIDLVPKGTNIISTLRTTAAVRPEPLSGGLQINGASGSENSFIIDGQEVSNFRTGTLNGNNDVPYQFVQEIQVRSTGFEAQFGGATGGVVTIATKSGTNDFRGEFSIQFNARTFNAAPRDVLSNVLDGAGQFGQQVEYLRQRRDSGTDRFPVASLGGPIIKDKLWFYGIYAPQIVSATRTTNFVTGYGANRVPSAAPFATPGVNATQNTTAKQTNEYGFIKLDAQPTDTLRVSSSFTYNPIVQRGLFLGGSTVIGTVPYGDFGGSTGVLSGSTLSNLQGGRVNANNFRIQGDYTPNAKLTATGRYVRGFLNEKGGSYFVPNTTRFRCRTVTAATLAASGCGAAGFQNTTNNFQIAKDVSIRNTVDADLSYLVSNFGGRHEFRGGYEYNKISNDVDEGYANNGIVHLYYGRTSFNYLCAGAFAPPSTTATINTGANIIGTGCIVRFGTRGKASNKNQALYIQDKYQPFSRLTINAGLRTEKEDLPSFNGQTTNLKFGFKDKLAPRLGVAFDLTGDGKTKISASYGRFFDRLKFELPRGSFGGDFYRVDFFEIAANAPAFSNYNVPRVIGNYGNPIGGGCPLAANTGYLTRCDVDYRVPSNLTGLNISADAPVQPGAVDPNLKPFTQDEYSVDVQRELFSQSFVTARYIHTNVVNAVEDAGFVTNTGSEYYYISNPGKGLYADTAKRLGFNTVAKAERRYDALQLEYATRLVKNFNANINYTFSRLYGNYSGLASSDENGRTSPGVNRFFDQPFVGFTASGQPDNGRLATDRPHVFKASGTYSFDYFKNKSNSTDLSFFTTAQSGTPLTSFVTVFGILIPETKRGNLGRTQTFTQTDFNLTHRYRFGRDNKFTFAFDINVLNAFNENHVLGIDNNRTSGFYGLEVGEVSSIDTATNFIGAFRDAVNILTSRGVTTQLNKSIVDPNGNGADFNLNRSFQKANLFQAPRTVRFGFRFLF